MKNRVKKERQGVREGKRQGVRGGKRQGVIGCVAGCVKGEAGCEGRGRV